MTAHGSVILQRAAARQTRARRGFVVMGWLVGCLLEGRVTAGRAEAQGEEG